MEYLSEFIAFFAGLGAGWTLKFAIDHSKKNSATQIGNKAGGDIAGRDIHKK